MPLVKPTKKEKANARLKLNFAPVLVPGPQAPHYLRKPKKGQNPLFFGGNSTTFVERLVPSAAGPSSASPSKTSTFANFESPEDIPLLYKDDFDTTPSSPRKDNEGPSPSKYRETRNTQWETWEHTVIPRLVHIWARVYFQTKALSELDKLPPPARKSESCSCTSQRVCKISVIRFTGMSPPRPVFISN